MYARGFAKGLLRKAFKERSKVILTEKTLHTSSNLQNADSDLFLHKSSLPTYHFQEQLPRLPVPRLEDTCQRYIRAITPLFSADQVARTQGVVDAFLAGEGQELQKELINYDRSNPDKTYISEPWFDMYINAREPLPLNFTAGLQFEDDERPAYMDQAIRATNSIVSTVRFMATLEAEKLRPYVVPTRPTERNKQFIKYLPPDEGCEGDPTPCIPLCMAQFKHAFKSTRIPRKKRDELKKFPEARHMVILRKGHFYTIEVLNNDGSPVAPASLLASVRSVLADPAPPAAHPLALMTTQDRDVWAEVREQLVREGNGAALERVDSAVIALALDDDDLEQSPELLRSVLHGNGANRWFDKSILLSLNGRGKQAMSFEHSWGDGVTGMYFASEMVKDIQARPAVGPDTQTPDSGPFERLEFRLSPDVQQSIDAARARFDAATAALDLRFAASERFGSGLSKRAGCSPDAVAQLGYQMAFYKLYGFSPPTYESCSTSMFSLGRTETIRSATSASLSLCQLVTSGHVTPSKQELRQAVLECSKMHGKVSAEAAIGQGHDRHLFGLRSLAQREGRPMPELFTDPSYGQHSSFVLSTSTVGAPGFLGRGAFGPVVPGGYGVTYGVKKDRMTATVTSYEARDCAGFVDALNESWNTLYEVLQD